MADDVLCRDGCQNCPFHSEKDGCGINYDGEPYATTKEAMFLILTMVSLPLIVTILDYLGVL